MTPELHKLWWSVFPNILSLFTWLRRYEEIGSAIARHRAQAVVLDLETSGPSEVEAFASEFPQLCIVGTHRLADDKLWTEAMSQGASDICEPRNDEVVRSVVQCACSGSRQITRIRLAFRAES